MTYQMKYTVSSGENLVDSRGVVVGTKTREGVLRMEMRVRHNGIQWEIVSLKPLK